MRILFVNDHGQEMGGKEKHLIALRSLLEEAGHRVGLIYTQPLDAQPSLHGDVVRFWAPGLDTYRGTLRTIARLRECLELFRPDVVHMHHNATNTFAAGWLMARYPVMRSVHDVEFLCPIRYYMRRRDNQPCSIAFGIGCFRSGCLSWWKKTSWSSLLKSKVFQLAHLKWGKMEVHSQFMKEGLSRLSFQDVPVFPLFVEVRDEQAESLPCFVYVGRLNRMKGPQVLIEAMQRVREPAVLDIVGAGEFRDELERQVERLKLSGRVRFAGYLGGEKLDKSFCNALAVIVPTLMPENRSIAIYEAFSYGRPVIASNLGGIPEIVTDGVNGFLVPYNDPISLADRMNQLLLDPEQARRFGSAGRQFLMAKQFRRDVCLQSLIDEYQATIEQFQKRNAVRRGRPR